MPDWFDGGGSGKRVDSMALLDGLGWECLRQVVALGAMVSVSETSDGGALGVTVTLDGRWRREYFRDADELALWATDALKAVEAGITQRPASPVPRSRSRGSRGL